MRGRKRKTSRPAAVAAPHPNQPREEVDIEEEDAPADASPRQQPSLAAAAPPRQPSLAAAASSMYGHVHIR